MKFLFYSLFSIISAWDPTLGAIKGYYNLSEVNSLLEHASETHQGTQLHSIGKSFNDQDIKALHLNSGLGHPVIIMGAHHARELISVTQVLSLMHYILEGQSAEIKFLRNNREIWFIPVVNVDSYQLIGENYDKTKEISFLRKNQNHFSNCSGKEEDIGVDLNRNYGYMFGIDNEGSSNNPCSEDYRGESAFSEPETKAIRDLLLNDIFIMALSYHSWGDLYIHPWCYKNSFDVADLRPGD